MARVRPHFKVHTSISHHRLMAKIYPDNDLLALWLRLGLVAIERFAAKSDDTLRVHLCELPHLTGGKRQDKARATLELLCSHLDLTLRLDGDYFAIEWRNLAIKQGFDSRTEDPETETETETETEVEVEVDAPRQASKSTSYVPAVIESTGVVLAPDFVLSLQQIRPGGVVYSDREIRDWFLQKQPQMAARGIRNFKRAASNWWKLATRAEVDAAVIWAQIKRLDVAKSDPLAECDHVDDVAAFARMFSKTEKEGVGGIEGERSGCEPEEA